MSELYSHPVSSSMFEPGLEIIFLVKNKTVTLERFGKFKHELTLMKMSCGVV